MDSCTAARRDRGPETTTAPHERNARETEFQLRAKLFCGQVTLDAKSFFAVWIENDHGWCPQSVETMEVSGVLFDVCLERHEVVVNKRSSLVIAVRLGFQPSTCASRGRGAKVSPRGADITLQTATNGRHRRTQGSTDAPPPTVRE